VELREHFVRDSAVTNPPRAEVDLQGQEGVKAVGTGVAEEGDGHRLVACQPLDDGRLRP